MAFKKNGIHRSISLNKISVPLQVARHRIKLTSRNDPVHRVFYFLIASVKINIGIMMIVSINTGKKIPETLIIDRRLRAIGAK